MKSRPGQGGSETRPVCRMEVPQLAHYSINLYRYKCNAAIAQHIVCAFVTTPQT